MKRVALIVGFVVIAVLVVLVSRSKERKVSATIVGLTNDPTRGVCVHFYLTNSSHRKYMLVFTPEKVSNGVWERATEDEVRKPAGQLFSLTQQTAHAFLVPVTKTGSTYRFRVYGDGYNTWEWKMSDWWRRSLRTQTPFRDDLSFTTQEFTP